MQSWEWLDEARAEEIARVVREELARRRISRQALADMAKISISTLEKALSGRRAFTLATVIRLEEALGKPLRSKAPSPSATPTYAPDELGAYARSVVRWMEGRYVTLRPLFDGRDGLYSYLTTIDWDGDASCLVFHESKRLDPDFAQQGWVSMPHLSGHIYLVTAESGQYRLAVLGRPTIAGSLYGILTTLLVGHGSQLVPAASPIALIRADRDPAPAYGRIEPGHPAYERYKAEVAVVTARDFARFPGCGDGR
ncbi:MAG TPA: helix-turn-helix transcriptional regulator [Allosphingosinicella sp.]|nr:helix-turn-helix transcriptional regulator [Allosphingosinicella sp.]